jgi:hypothetical protein
MSLRYGWSLTRDHWEEFSSAIASYATTRWKVVKLRDIDQDSVPSCTGIYAISARVERSHKGFPPSLENVVYVGKATSLRGRFVDHCLHPAPELKRAKSCFHFHLDFWFIECGAAATAKLESLLIECLGPSVNQVSGAITAIIRATPRSP